MENYPQMSTSQWLAQDLPVCKDWQVTVNSESKWMGRTLFSPCSLISEEPSWGTGTALHGTIHPERVSKSSLPNFLPVVKKTRECITSTLI